MFPSLRTTGLLFAIVSHTGSSGAHVGPLCALASLCRKIAIFNIYIIIYFILYHPLVLQPESMPEGGQADEVLRVSLDEAAWRVRLQG